MWVISVLRFHVSIAFWLFWLPLKVHDLLCNRFCCNLDPKFITWCNSISNVLRYKVLTKSCCTSIQTKRMNTLSISRGMFMSANLVSTHSGYRKVNYYLLAENTPLSHSLLIEKWNNVIRLTSFTISGRSWLCGMNRLLSTVWTKTRWSDWHIWGSGMSWLVRWQVLCAFARLRCLENIWNVLRWDRCTMMRLYVMGIWWRVEPRAVRELVIQVSSVCLKHCTL